MLLLVQLLSQLAHLFHSPSSSTLRGPTSYCGCSRGLSGGLECAGGDVGMYVVVICGGVLITSVSSHCQLCIPIDAHSPSTNLSGCITTVSSSISVSGDAPQPLQPILASACLSVVDSEKWVVLTYRQLPKSSS